MLLIAVNVPEVFSWGNRTTRRSGWGWSGGPTYTFKNGIQITGSGSLKPLTIRVGVKIRFRRETDGENDGNQRADGNVVTGKVLLYP